MPQPTVFQSTVPHSAVDYLLNADAIRERCENIFLAAMTGRTQHFTLDLDKLDACIDYVVSVTTTNYPDLQIPFHSRWRHLESHGEQLVDTLCDRHQIDDPAERARIAFDIAVTSVLLDAGAGDSWRYRDPRSQQSLSRSEGLAKASFDWYARGAFASDAKSLRADAERLQHIDVPGLKAAFQVDVAKNTLVGISGRVDLLNRLGAAVSRQPEVFGTEQPRVGHFFDYLVACSDRGTLAARHILKAVLTVFGPVWPTATSIFGYRIGDVWRHPHAGGRGPTAGWVPFHKLSQWLTYSLVEPLEIAGVSVTDLDELTGLPEYRNGGLLIDSDVLRAVDRNTYLDAIAVDDERIVEWRALTVVLLDRIAEGMRERLSLDRHALPLARVLQGGTWQAGRNLAAQRRDNARPPITLASEGTVF